MEKLVFNDIDGLKVVFQKDWAPTFSTTAVWVLGHYPGHQELVSRLETADAIHRRFGSHIWLFAGKPAGYPVHIGREMKEALLQRGVKAEHIVCFPEKRGVRDTVEEITAVLEAAKERGVRRVVCVSNALQLCQVWALLPSGPVEFYFVPSPLKDWRWWYITARLALIPVAWLGWGRRFPPLQLLRYLRAHWKHCRI